MKVNIFDLVLCCVGAQNRYMKNIMKIQSKGISVSHVRIFNVSECVVRKEMQCNTPLIESGKILLTIPYLNAIKATHAIFICKNSFCSFTVLYKDTMMET